MNFRLSLGLSSKRAKILKQFILVKIVLRNLSMVIDVVMVLGSVFEKITLFCENK